MTDTWRLIPPIAASGKIQMAIDRYLLARHRQGKHPPAIRFYTWQPAAISLGYHQKKYPDFWSELTWQGQPVEIVRRPTGGSAVLHQGDLTYMVVTSIPPGKRLEVYKQICQFLIVGWRSLGVDLNYGTEGREYIQRANCFATATGSDLVTVEGHKVIGSAQLRRGQSVLQHGSIDLNTDRQLYQKVFNTSLNKNLFEVIAPQNVRSAGYADEYTTAKIIKSLTQAATAIFKIDLVEQPLSTAEWQDIASAGLE